MQSKVGTGTSRLQKRLSTAQMHVHHMTNQGGMTFLPDFHQGGRCSHKRAECSLCSLMTACCMHATHHPPNTSSSKQHPSWISANPA